VAKNKLSDLRNHLFETIETLKDNDNDLRMPIEIERAKAVAQVAQAIINSAKLELQFLGLSGQEAKSEFLEPPDTKARPSLLPINSKSAK
jgi:hypothetical protein